MLNISNTMFDPCTILSTKTESKLKQIESSSGLIGGRVSAITKGINDQVSGPGFSSSDIVDAAVDGVLNHILPNIPDYTNRDLNTGPALELYDAAFRDFQNILEHCIQMKAPDMLKLLGCDEIPDIDVYDIINLGASNLTKFLKEGIDKFPIKYLSSIKDSLLKEVGEYVRKFSGFLPEFDFADFFDGLDQNVKKLTDYAKHLDTMLDCAKALACTNVADYQNRFKHAMTTIPLSPSYTSPSGTILKPLPDFKISTNDIMNNSNIVGLPNATEVMSNMNNAKESYSKVLDNARAKFSKF